MSSADEISSAETCYINRTNGSSATNSISEMKEFSESQLNSNNAGLKYLPKWPAVNIDFQDLVYSVPDAYDGNKVILRGVTGHFKSSQLTAILGPSGAGKSTLLNILAGYKCSGATGTISINNKPRDMKIFRKMSRYIMQQDVYQPMLTVREAMMISADLKLGNDLTKNEKNDVINEILSLLRLTKASNTMGHKLSGGEKKRLSIALELVNNPPVIFLDEPTTGLDDLSCSQCIALLRRIAHGGRTVICSVHTPSAKIFAMFDHVYIVAAGQCVYQGSGNYIVPYMQSIGLNCPVTYNPSDFVIEVTSGEYGAEYLDKMVSGVENGRCLRWKPTNCSENTNGENDIFTGSNIELFEEEIDPKQLKARTSTWQQFLILHQRMTTQMWRDSTYMKLRIVMYILLGFLIGGLFVNMGNDASKTLFNFGFCFTIIIFYMYIPMMPILLEFPQQVQLLKREHFNRWYRLSSYYAAMVVAKLPIQIFLGGMYMTMVYLLTDQPLEWHRIGMFYTAALLVSLTSESLGLLIASRLSIVNGMFVGPVVTVPVMLLAVYGIGFGKGVTVPAYIRFLMSLSYLRYGLEALISAVYGYNRKNMVCPEDEVYCQYNNAKYLLVEMGFEEADFTVDALALLFFYILFNVVAYWLIKQRLSVKRSNFVAVQYIAGFVKTHLNFTSYKY